MTKSINSDTTTPRKRRPPETGTPVTLRLQADQLAQVDDWRRTQPDLPGRPEAIRRVLAEKLGAK